MRSSFLVSCCALALSCVLRAQDAAAPAFTSHPESVIVHVGDPFTLSVTVEGTAPIMYRWHRDTLPIDGTDSPTFSIAVTELVGDALFDAAMYYVVAQNAFGSATSRSALVYIIKRPQTITLAPTPATAPAGSSVMLGATSSSGLPVTFALVSGAGSLNGNMLTGNGGAMTVRALQAGNASYAAADPVERTIAFVTGSLSPFITSPPMDQTVNAGSNVTFRASAIGTPGPVYQWDKDGAAISGATGATLTLANVTLADTGRYTIVATNASGVSTRSAQLTVRAAPVLTTVPDSQTIFAGSPYRFTVAATGFPPPTYQWRKNGTAISGATNATHTVASAAIADAGTYDAVVSNLLGSATTPPATLTIQLRDFAGQYFGQFTSGSGEPGAGPSGDFSLHVRPDRSAVFLGHLPGVPAGIVTRNLGIELNGSFSLALPTVAPTPRPVTLRGAIDDATGDIAGTVAELGISFLGTRAPRAGPALAGAGFYQAALIGSAAARGFVIAAPDGQAFVLTASGEVLDAARGTVGADGRLALTTATQTVLELGFSEGALNGTIRTAAGVTGAIAGAVEALLGREHLVNLSVRSATTAAAPLITGFVISGTAAKQVLVRVAGPALTLAPFNVANAVANPSLQIFRGTTSVGQNNSWGTPAANATAVTAATAQTGAFPFRTGSNDAALVTTLQPGAYTVVVGGNGTALAEVYEVLQNNEAVGARRLANISARGAVSPGAPLIAGFVIGGTAPQRVLIRGIGPRLGAAPFNVAGTLANPQLTLFQGTTVVKTNDDWFRDAEATLISTAATRAGAFALGANSLDAAMLLYLEPGAYTAQVSGPPSATPAAGTGLALVEVYESAP